MNDIINEAERCLKCKKPLCSAWCPVNTKVPEIMKLFLEGKIEEAGELLFNNNPLSICCSIICPHEDTCLGHCILNKKGKPIYFYQVEHYISEYYLARPKEFSVTENNKLVGIIGAGPAGITLAILLRQRGFNVTIIDSMDKIGGVLRYGIPEFRLPKSNLDLLLAKMKTMGIRFRPNTLIGPTITVDQMFDDGYDAVFIGTGAWRPNRLRIKGESLGNTHYAIDFLKNPKSYDNLGDKVLVIGAGNVAMDASRTIVRGTSADVEVIFFRGEEDVTCSEEEFAYAKVDGVRFNYYLNTVEILEDGIIVEDVLKSEDASGKTVYFNDESTRRKIECTSVIIAVGQGPKANIVKNTTKLETSPKGLINAGESGITSRAGVFAAGDVVSGPKTVVEAVAFSKRVADEIEKYCLNKE